ncbi:coiled-coil domain-containing protein [Nocardiopsis trehalosi]|uniref:hypothetical protein n=1 Tax=Nocardiopsis trehalosi TaxID=109329 RepID=UPI000833B61F|nr:hypothetical protein [Nocardiopsis trehalosi]
MPRSRRVPRPAADRGAGYPEYALTVLLVAAVLAALIGSGVSARVSEGIADAVCAVGAAAQDDRDCGSDAGATGGAPRPLAAADPTGAGWLVPLEDLPGPPPPQEGRGDLGQWEPGADEEWFSFEDRGDYTWDCGTVADVACKIGGGFAQGVRDLWDGAASGLCLLHVCSHAGFTENWSSVGQVFRQNPLTTAGQMWEGFSAPFRENWREAGPGKTIAYALPAALGGALKAFKFLGRDRADPPDPLTAGDLRADLDEARAAAERGDIEAADEAIAAAQDKIDDVAERAEHAGCPSAAPARPAGTGPTPMATAPLHLAAGGDCGAADRLAAELGVTGDAHLADILDTERRRRDFFATRTGRRVAAQVEELLNTADEAEEFGREGRSRKAERRADRARTLAEDLRRQADKETDPDRRRFLEDAADTADLALVRARDGARTAQMVQRLDDVPGSVTSPTGPKPLREQWAQVDPVMDYNGTGAPYLDRATVGEGGRPILRVDRSLYNSDAELTAAVARTLILDGRGYYERRADGLRAINWRQRDEWNRGDLSIYVQTSVNFQTEGYLASVRALDNDGIAPAHVADPMMRQIYSEALDHVEAHPDRLRDAKGRPLKGDELAAAREDLIRSSIERSMAMPQDGLGGQRPIDAFVDEYESVHPRGEDDY